MSGTLSGARGVFGARVGVFDWQKRLRRDAKASGLRPASLGSLMILATYADPNGANAFPSASKLAGALGMRRDTIGTAWADGVRCGWLTVDGLTPRGTKRYALTAPTLSPNISPFHGAQVPQGGSAPESRRAAVGGHAPVSGVGCSPERAGGAPDRRQNQSLHLTPTNTVLRATEQGYEDEEEPRGAAAWARVEEQERQRERDVAARWEEFLSLELQPLRL